MNIALTEEIPAELHEALQRSAEQAARGEFVPLEPVLDRIRARIASAEARVRGQQAVTEV